MKMRHLFRLTIVVLCVLFAFAGATGGHAESQGAADGQSKTSELQKQIVDRIVKDGSEQAEKLLKQMYQTFWINSSMDSRLTDSLNRAVSEKIEEQSFGTQTWKLLFSSDFKQAVLDRIAFYMNPHMEGMMAKLEGAYMTAYHELLQFQFRTAVASTLGLYSSPAQRGYIRYAATDLLRSNGEGLIATINVALQERFPNFKIEAGYSIGTMMLVASNFIFKNFWDDALRMILPKVGSQLLKFAGVVGWIYSAADLAYTVFTAEDAFKKELSGVLENAYKQDLPDQFWQTMSKYVVAGFEEAGEIIARAQKDAEAIESSQKVAELSRGMDEEEKRAFVERLAALARTTHVSLEGEKFFEDFGEIIRDVPPSRFSELTQLLKENRSVIKRWIELAGLAEYFELRSALPPLAWEKFAPNEDSLRVLRWMVLKLPAAAREKALKLDTVDQKWIVSDFPERYLSDLFAEKYTVSDIHYEIERLHDIPDKRLRRPWMNDLIYFWTLHRRGVGMAVLAVVGFAGLYMAFTLRKVWNHGGKPGVPTTPYSTPSGVDVRPINEESAGEASLLKINAPMSVRQAVGVWVPMAVIVGDERFEGAQMAEAAQRAGVKLKHVIVDAGGRMTVGSQTGVWNIVEGRFAGACAGFAFHVDGNKMVCQTENGTRVIFAKSASFQE